MSHPTFADLGVPAALSAVLARDAITIPTPIQAATLPDSLSGTDVLGRGRTGSGKTYAFLLPVVARLSDLSATTEPARQDTSGASRARTPRSRRPRAPRALILVPTRELAGQVGAALAPLASVAGLSTVTIFGGVGQNPQVTALRNGVDIIIACPGRLEDLMQQGHCSLASIEISVLDEADHMADLGFLPGVKRILDATPARSQRLLFSATLDSGVSVLVKRYLTNPVTHHADSPQSPVATMTHHVLHVTKDDRVPVLADLAAAPGRSVLFTRTKHGAKSLTRALNARGVPAVELHGNLGQTARTRNLAAFASGEANTLVATDIAARGIHVDDVALVIHADPPAEQKAYVHRSGRTARAGASGTVITVAQEDQLREVRALTKAAGVNPTTTKVSVGHPLLRELAPGEREVHPPVVAQPAQQGRAQGTPRAGGSSATSAARHTPRNGQRRGDGQARTGGQSRTPGQKRTAAQGRAGTGSRAGSARRAG